MPSVFTRIIRREIPAYIVAENEQFIAFLDAFPLVKGHTLVVPKKETDYIFDIDDNEYQELQLFAKRVALALKKAVPCKRIGVTVIGDEVPHAHIHLVPLNSAKDMNFSNAKLKLAPAEMEEIASAIRHEWGE